MNFRAVFHLISFLLLFTAVGQFASWGVAWLYEDPSAIKTGLLYASLLSTAIGGTLWLVTRGPMDLSRRDGFGIVTFGWLAIAHLGTLPYLFTGDISDPFDALFESMSGFTATGASAIPVIEELSYGVLFWRALTQWYGGMGIIVLCVAILPFLGVGGMQLYRAEISGPSKDRLTPRIESTAKLLWFVYVLLTLAAILFLYVAGLSWFDAVCKGFTTIATGGFATTNHSAAAANSFAVELVMVVFMILGALHFPLHYRAITGRPLNYFKNPEFRFFMMAWAVFVGLVTFNIWGPMFPSLFDAFRAALFQCTSIITTSGFVTENYDAWPAASRFLLLIMMMIGGCAGSTSGGIKAIRVFALLKKSLREIRLFMLPNAVVQVKIGRQSIDHTIISNITSFFFIFMSIWAVATLLMTVFTPDLETAFSSVVATLGNVGPAFGHVGPTAHYGWIEAPGKVLLTLLMLVGRLELYTVLVLLLPSFWRK